ncbi:MAG: hypothetical protein ACPGXZ_10710 [Saprospiraceae bacterium]
MQEKIFISIFNDAIPLLSLEWKGRYAELLHHEHWNIIGHRIFFYLFKNEISHNPLPFFDEEIVPDYVIHYQYLKKIELIIEKNDNEKAQFIAKIIEETPVESLLIILGQRKTSATITDENGIPPITEQLLKNSFLPYNPHTSKASRAREKHISRNKETSVWGKIEGNPSQKEQVTKMIVKKIIEEKTWWNVFTHYKHGVVYEVRIASGQGIRWKKDNLELIGFLEPFI